MPDSGHKTHFCLFSCGMENCKYLNLKGVRYLKGDSNNGVVMELDGIFLGLRSET